MKKTTLALAVGATLSISAASAWADDAPAAAAAAPAAAAPPASPLSFNVGVVSDYIFRGVTQTHGGAAIQGGVDWADPSGFYVGAWASNITWVKDYTNKGDVELDVYGGYKGAFAGGDWTYQLGVITYNYPGHGDANIFGANPNTTEVLASLGYKWLSVTYSYATSSHFIGWYSSTGGDTKGSGYFEANGSWDLGNGWGLTAHAGHQTVKDFSPASYSDENIGITKDVGFGVVGFLVSTTSAKGKTGEPYSWPNSNFVAGVGSTSGFKNVAKSEAVLSFLKTF